MIMPNFQASRGLVDCMRKKFVSDDQRNNSDATPITKNQTREVKADGVWRTVSLARARTLYTLIPKRYLTCHCQIIITGNFTHTGGYKLQHRHSRSGCPLTPAAFTGILSPTRKR